jgi:anti-anti-sigma regulatory factor
MSQQSASVLIEEGPAMTERPTDVPGLLVAVADHVAVVKINGRANFTMSVSFKRLVCELCNRGTADFVLDLTECATMDSTFLGVLASTALNHSHSKDTAGVPDRNDAAARLRLLNPSARVAELLDNLGVADLFTMVRCDPSFAGARELKPAEEAKASRAELSRACLEAHQLLMELNPANISRFKDVAQFLAEDLKRMAGETNGPSNGAAPNPERACSAD